MRTGKFAAAIAGQHIRHILTVHSIQFNIVSKGLGSERMSFYLNEAAGLHLNFLIMPLP